MNARREAGPGTEITPQHASLVVLVTACFAHFWICRSLSSEIALDVDPVNLLYGMHELNPAHHAPHPPGYVVYVWMLRALHAFVDGAPWETVQLLGRLFSTATIPLTYLATRMLRPENPMAWAYAALLSAFHPFLLFHGVDAQTHGAEAFAAGLLLVAVLSYRRFPTGTRAVILGALLAFGSSLRPSFVVAGVGPVLWAIGWRRPAHLLAAGAVSLAGALAWLIPTWRVSGGYARWRAANDALVQDLFVRTNSVLSADSLDAFVFYNFANTLLWLVLLVAPLVVVLAMRGSLRIHGDRAYGDSLQIVLWTLGPSAVFYLSFFCSEPGYLLGVAPCIVVLTSVAASGVPVVTRRRLSYAGAVMIQIVILFAPSAPPDIPIGKIPSLTELIERDAIYRTALARVVDAIPPNARALYVTDYVDVTFSRQLPLQVPGLHSMIVHSEHWPIFDHTTAGLVTDADWIPIPGPALLEPGPPTIVEVPFSYDFVMVGLAASNDLRQELGKHTTCDLGKAEGELRARVLPTTDCFSSGLLEAHGQGIRFRVPAPSNEDSDPAKTG